MALPKDFVCKDNFCKLIGVEAVNLGENIAVTRLKIEEYHLNGIKTTQGGAIFTLADYAFALICNQDDNVVTGINMEITYVKAAKIGDILTAEATPKYTNTKIPVYNVNVTNQNNELIAIFQGMGYRLSKK